MCVVVVVVVVVIVVVVKVVIVLMVVVILIVVAVVAVVVIVAAVVVGVSTTARVSPQWALVAQECLLIATYAMVPACLNGKLSLTALSLSGLLLRQLHQVHWSSDAGPTSRMSTCFTLQITLQVMSNGGLQIDMRRACIQEPQMMSRRGPNAGTRSSNGNRSFDGTTPAPRGVKVEGLSAGSSGSHLRDMP